MGVAGREWRTQVSAGPQFRVRRRPAPTALRVDDEAEHTSATITQTRDDLKHNAT
jgi:hypothetical protein